MASFTDPGGPTGKNMQVSATGAEQVGNDIGGYSIVQAESIEAAAKMLATSPHFKTAGGTIDLAEIVPMGK